MARKKRIPVQENLVQDSDIDDYEDQIYSGDNDQKILDEINDNIHNWMSYFAQNITNSRFEKYFTFVDNWTPKQRTELNMHKKPILQANKVYDAVNKVLAEQRQNTSELKVRSLTGKAPDNIVKLNQDFVRYICFNSKSRIAYQTAYSDQISGGFGAFMVRADYESPDSFEQSIIITPRKEPEKCFFDPFAQDITRSDGDFCGFYVSMSKKDFERKYPDVPYPTSFPIPTNVGEFSWGLKDKITIVEYYKKVYFEFKLHKLSDGRTVRDDEWKRIQDEPEMPPFQSGMEMQSQNAVVSMFAQAMMPPKPTIIKTITKRDHKIVMFHAIYNQIVERQEFPCKELPMVFLPGGVKTIDGQDITISFVRFAKDMQVVHNYLLCDIAFNLQTGRKERFMGTKENVAGVEKLWENVANVQGLLVANPDSVTKQMPIPIPPAEIAASSISLFQQSELSIQNILGFYEANRGADSNAQSGIAYKEQQRAGSMSVGVFNDNLNTAIEQCGRIVMSMKKYIYDTERKIPVMTQNGKVEFVDINQPVAGGMIDNDMTQGDFDVVIDAGPSLAVQKEKSLEILVQLCGLNPQVFPLLADLIGENLSLEGIVGIVARLKTLVPPQVIAQEEGKPMPPPQPDPQMMIMQQQMQLKERDQQIQQAKLNLEMQKMESQIQNLQKEIEVTQIKAQAEIQKAAIEHNATMVETTGKIIDSHNNVKREIIKR